MAVTQIDNYIIANLRNRTRLLEAVVENFPGGIALFDANLRLVVSNDRLRVMLDYPEHLFRDGGPTLETLFRFNAARGEYGPGDAEEHVRLRMDLARQKLPHTYERVRPNGVVLEIRGIPLADGGFVTTYLDVTEQRRAQAEVARLAYHDPLTGLANRSLMLDRLGQLLARARRGELCAVHFLDLDRFKAVNDTFGHAAGDALLQAVATRLRIETRETDTLARIGGDEFVILQTAVGKRDDVEVVASRIVRSLGQRYEIDGQFFDIGVSVGIALTPDDGQDADTLLRHADEALYRCKVASRNAYQFYQREKPVDEVVA